MAKFILGHEHVFNNEIVPEAFLGNKTVQNFVRNNYNAVTRGLSRIVPFLDNDVFDRYANFVVNGEKSVADNVEYCVRKAKEVFMSDDVAVNVLMMDMSCMGAGFVPMSLTKQFLELRNIRKEYPINIFLACDPRNLQEFWNIVKMFPDDIAGVKLYPLLGYFPYDERLDEVYDWCSKNKKVVISHCSHYNAVHYRGSDIDELLKDSVFEIEHKHGSKKKKASNFCNPKGFELVSQKFPRLKLVIAHLGGYDEVRKYMKGKDSWTATILDICKRHKNVYTDISYTMSYTDLIPCLTDILSVSALRNKVLYGSDFYMNDIALKKDFHTPIYEKLSLHDWNALIHNWGKLFE